MSVQRVLPVLLAVPVLAASTAADAGENIPAPQRPAHGLPNLVMHRITDVAIAPWHAVDGERVPGRWAVRFTSTVDNRGRGHFVLRARRDAVGQPCAETEQPENRCEAGDMTADQVVIGRDGTERVFPAVGEAYFDDPHNHWHLRAGERYVLRTMNGKRVSADVKTGFCFGDRLHYTDVRPPNFPGLRNDLVNCAPGNGDPAQDGRRTRTLLLGISAGWSDDYPSYEPDGTPLEGQQLEITGLPEGRYRLVNEPNPDGRFRETTRRDNAASVVFALTWPGGARPQIDVLSSCVRKPRCRG